ncbi:MAG: T9SS type A sorting domain-containing protein [Candidatus Krumholzibacteriota bacterium]|nr:T9SS type A sorting domain-containing protein [Candidatus Krumholzibacteriota bacterium]
MNRLRRVIPLILIGFLIPTIAIAIDQSKPQPEPERGSSATMPVASVAAGGVVCTTPEVFFGGTLGQSSPAGIGTDGEHVLFAGFCRSVVSTILTDADTPEPPRNLLLQNFPNPFNPETAIRFSVAEESDVSIRIFDVRGREIRTLVDKRMPPGAHSVYWTGEDNAGRTVGSGVYFCKLQIDDYASVKKMLMLK